jgi:quercetin dioxygenase-like cupin family protein
MPTDKPSPTPGRVAKSPLPQKPPAAPTEILDLETEAQQLRAEPPYEQHGQSAKTLVKHEHFRVVLIAVKSGRRCREHKAEESVSIQAVEGRVKVNLASQEQVDLPRGCVVVLAPELAHDIEALEDSTLLLTMAWTGHHDDRRDSRQTH